MKENKRGFDLRRKIFVVFISSVLLLVAVSVTLVSIFINTRGKYDFFIDSIVEKKIVLWELEFHLAKAEGTIRDLLLKSDFSLSESVRDSIRFMTDNVNSLYELDLKISDFKNDPQHADISKRKRDEVIALIQTFNGATTNVLDLHVEKGLSSDLGLRGRFRSYAHELEEAIGGFDSDRLLAEYLMMRRHEKDYLLRNDVKYISAVASQSDLIIKMIESLDLREEESVAMKLSLDRYYKGFAAVREINGQIESAMDELQSVNRRVVSYIDSELASVDAFLIQEKSELSENVRATIRNVLFSGLFILILEIILAFIIMRSISRPMEIIIRDTERLESGDLSVPISYDKNDEMGRVAGFVNSAVTSFRNLISRAQNVSEQSVVLTSSIVATASETAAATTQINANINSINKKTNLLLEQVDSSDKATEDIKNVITRFKESVHQQSASIEQSTTAIEEMTSTIQSVAQIAQERGQAAEVLHRVTENGAEKINKTNQLIGEVSRIAEDILNITKIINGIAAQTNLLAMNAAIEAAHAGDVGRGFAVVADEIRKLAESSSVNAKQINSLLKEAGMRIASASEASTGSISSFQDVKSEVDTFVTSLSEIAASMAEMSIGSREILKSTSHLSMSMTEITTETNEIVDDVDNIGNSMKSVNILTNETTNGIAEIQLAIAEIDKSIIDLNEKCVENEELMEKMDGSLKEFRV